jgi:hypothetical protein
MVHRIAIGDFKVILAPINIRLDFAYITFFDQVVYLVRSIRGGDMSEIGKLMNRRPVKVMNYVDAKRLRSGQACFTALEAIEHLTVEMKLKFFIYVDKPFWLTFHGSLYHSLNHRQLIVPC